MYYVFPTRPETDTYQFGAVPDVVPWIFLCSPPRHIMNILSLIILQRYTPTTSKMIPRETTVVEGFATETLSVRSIKKRLPVSSETLQACKVCCVDVHVLECRAWGLGIVAHAGPASFSFLKTGYLWANGEGV